MVCHFWGPWGDFGGKRAPIETGLVLEDFWVPPRFKIPPRWVVKWRFMALYTVTLWPDAATGYSIQTRD